MIKLFFKFPKIPNNNREFKSSLRCVVSQLEPYSAEEKCSEDINLCFSYFLTKKSKSKIFIYHIPFIFLVVVGLCAYRKQSLFEESIPAKRYNLL